MSEIKITTEEFEGQIRLHLNNAQASLTTMQPKYAGSGLVSAASVMVLSEMVVRHQRELHDRELARFEEYYRMGLDLLNEYWRTFRLVLLQQAGVEQPVTVVRQVEPKTQEKHIVQKRHYTPRTSDIDKAAIRELLLSGQPTDCTQKEWFQTIAEDKKCSWWVVRKEHAKIMHENGNGNH